MKEFYLPYNFIPVTGIISKKQQGKQRLRSRYDYNPRCEQQEIPEQGAIDSAKTQARHDLWQTGRHSGKFICRLCIISPTVVGNEHHSNEYTDRPGNEKIPDHPTVVCQYTWNGQPALPANSLRGMISSLAETLSQSSLRVLDQKFHPAFANIDSDLPPWNEQRVRNGGLTPAELLFGVVENNTASGEDERRNRAQDEHTHNLASRVRFYDAVLADGEKPEDVLDDSVVLQMLASPKPEGSEGDGKKKFELKRPSLYFRDSQTNPVITYDELREYLKGKNRPHPLPHGRKFYLLREKPGQLDSTLYQTKPKQGEITLDVENKLLCEPIKSGTQFEFTVVFENLSNAEMTLLKTALVPDPQQSFYHRLGLGKPLGMGIVQVEITEAEYIDRKQRYSVDGLLNGGGKTAKEPQDDPALIDDETLKQVLKAGSLKSLRAGVPVHWRAGQDKAAPLPQLNPADELLPDFYELRNSASGTKGKPEVCGDDSAPNFIVEPGEEQTEAVAWLKDEISILNNGKSFEELKKEEVEDTLVSKALSNSWLKMKNNDDRLQVKELLFLAVDKRGLGGHWKHSKGRQKALKNYTSWP